MPPPPKLSRHDLAPRRPPRLGRGGINIADLGAEFGFTNIHYSSRQSMHHSINMMGPPAQTGERSWGTLEPHNQYKAPRHRQQHQQQGTAVRQRLPCMPAAHADAALSLTGLMYLVPSAALPHAAPAGLRPAAHHGRCAAHALRPAASAPLALPGTAAATGPGLPPGLPTGPAALPTATADAPHGTSDRTAHAHTPRSPVPFPSRLCLLASVVLSAADAGRATHGPARGRAASHAHVRPGPRWHAHDGPAPLPRPTAWIPRPSPAGWAPTQHHGQPQAAGAHTTVMLQIVIQLELC